LLPISFHGKFGSENSSLVNTKQLRTHCMLIARIG